MPRLASRILSSTSRAEPRQNVLEPWHIFFEPPWSRRWNRDASRKTSLQARYGYIIRSETSQASQFSSKRRFAMNQGRRMIHDGTQPRGRWLLPLAAVGMLGTVPSAIRAGDWPGGRGPTGLGYTDEKDLPLTWDAKTNTNIIWKALL